MKPAIKSEPGGLRLYLEGKPMHAGAAVEYLAKSGKWIAGRYEYRLEGTYLLPFFYFEAEGEEVCITLMQCDELRWPAGGGR